MQESSDRSLRPGDECQAAELQPGDRFRMIGGDLTWTLENKAGKPFHCRSSDSEGGVLLDDYVVYLGPPEPARVESLPATRILKGSELLVGDVVEYAASELISERVAKNWNSGGPFTVARLPLPSQPLSGMALRDSNFDWIIEYGETFRLLSRLDAKPEFPRQGTRADLVPGMRYRFDDQSGECVCLSLGLGRYKYRVINDGFKGEYPVDNVMPLTLLGMDETFIGIDPAAGPDQAVEVTTGGSKVTEAKVIATRPNCEVCLKPHTFTAGYGVLVELTLKGEWICTDCSGARRPMKPRPEPPQARKLPPSAAYHLNDVGGDEGPGWSE